MDSKDWIIHLRSVLHENNSPIKIRNGHWEVLERKTLWNDTAVFFFDNHLEQLKTVCNKVLSEPDPQFDLAAKDRFAASIHGKVLNHSSSLRIGLSETIALLGNEGSSLVNCSQHLPKRTAADIVHKLLRDADWVRWGSLNDLLPNLAEASPETFLTCVEEALRIEHGPFLTLFQESKEGLTRHNYLVGLLWALEALAWSEDYFMRTALVVAELASIDPGGNEGNRPINSLRTILLPWLPQTIATTDTRIVSVQAIKSEFPDVAWKLLTGLLPSSHQTSSGTNKPRWIQYVPEDWRPDISNEEYRYQVKQYAELAVDMALEDLGKLNELLHNLDNLPKPSFTRLLEYLSSDPIRSLPELDRQSIWNTLNTFIQKHRRFSDSDWALNEETVKQIDDVASFLVPTSKPILYERLFGARDHDLYEQAGDWEAQRKLLEQKRRAAIQEILTEEGIEGIKHLAMRVNSSALVGGALGSIKDHEVDTALLPVSLSSNSDEYRKFISAFIWSRFFNFKSTWIEGLQSQGWTTDEKCSFLVCLPFEEDTWKLVEKWLSNKAVLYWMSVPVNPFASDSDLLIAVDNLLKADRPWQAVECLSARLHKKLPLDIRRTSAALKSAVKHDLSPDVDSYDIRELIKALQKDPSTPKDDLINIEWSYLPILDGGKEANATTLQQKLSTEPAFFCEIIRTLYRSSIKDEEATQNLDESKKAFALNAWRLLNNWKLPPGTNPDGTFSSTLLEQWVSDVKSACSESGHYEVAMMKLGEVLLYCPADRNGLWIVECAAKLLNSRDGEEMRRGFCSEIFNSRGAHWVDPTGNAEREIASKWRERAKALEKAAYPRFSSALRELANSYDEDAERVVRRHEDRRE